MTTRQALARAAALAEQSVGRTAPNPPVGCVIVADGQVIGEGWHKGPGQAHAEREALDQAGHLARGATLYCTLEPCCHYGRTPPCTQAIIAAGIGRVVFATFDPDPRVAGQGAAELREAGVAVEITSGGPRLERLLAPYLHARRTGRPWVLAKWAMTLDGKLAAASGDSRWVSGPQAQRWVHEQRDRSDAILVGSGTVLADDPQLTVRLDHPARPPRPPLRVVVDTQARVPSTAAVFTDEAAPTLWVVGVHRPAPEVPGVECLRLPERDGHVDLGLLLDELGRRGLLQVLCEAGGRLTGALLAQHLVQEVAAIIAPKLIGGHGPSPWDAEGQPLMSRAINLRQIEYRRLRRDILVRGYIRDTETTCSPA